MDRSVPTRAVAARDSRSLKILAAPRNTLVDVFITDASVVYRSNFVGGTGSEFVLSTPLRFTLRLLCSRPCAKSPDEEIEYFRKLAEVMARGRGRIARPTSSVLTWYRVGSSTVVPAETPVTVCRYSHARQTIVCFARACGQADWVGSGTEHDDGATLGALPVPRLAVVPLVGDGRGSRATVSNGADFTVRPGKCPSAKIDFAGGILGGSGAVKHYELD